MTAFAAETTPAAKSKVVIARDAQLHPAGSTQPDEKRVQALLDHAMASYTGKEKPVDAWKSIVPVDKVIGLKVNGLAARESPRTMPDHGRRRAAAAGWRQARNIIVWDQNQRFLEATGVTLSQRPQQNSLHRGRHRRL